MDTPWKDPLNDFVLSYLNMDLFEALTEPRLRREREDRFKPQLGIRPAVVTELQQRGFKTVGDLYWRGIDWFTNTQAIWVSDELRDEILKEMVAFDDYVKRFRISITELLFWQTVKLPGGFLPSVNNLAGEIVFNPREKHDCDALPWRDSW